MDKFYLECECHAFDHIVRFMSDDDEPEIMYVDYLLWEKRNIFQRICNAIRYIFNGGEPVWNETLVNKKELKRLIDYLEETHNKMKDYD